MIWQSVPDEDLDAAVSEIAEKFKRASPDAVVRIRETINESIHNSFSSQLDLEMEHQAVLIPKNMKAGAQAFLEKRVPTFSEIEGNEMVSAHNRRYYGNSLIGGV